MAEKILDKTLSGDLAVDQLLEWLVSSSSLQDSNVSRGEFVPYFLNYLRQSTSWIFQNPENCVQQGSLIEIPRPTPSTKDRRLLSYSTPLRNIEVNNSSHSSTRSEDPRSRRTKKNGKFHESSSSIAEKKWSPDINDLSAFPPLDDSPSKVRRINPTPLAHNPQKSAKRVLHSSFKKSESIVLNSVFSPPYEAKRNSLSERDLLKVAKEKFVNRQPVTCCSNTQLISVKRKNTIVSSVDPAVHVLPSLSLVTCKNRLNMFVEIYSGLLVHGLVPNITSEFHFVFQLLSSNATASNINGALFGSAHNCVYFAVRILEKNESFVELLDNNTLAALLKIPYLPKFSRQLSKLLENSIKDKNAVRVALQSSIEEVAFREDIDTRKNFPSNECFSSFSKQRDMFYEIFEEWQLNCMKDVWCESWFKKKVCKLLELSVDPINYFSLARLIKSQILISCLHGDEDLKNNMHEKFDMLQDRISVQRGNPCPPPTFPGAQGFFEAFLKAADSDSLNRYLQDVFVFDIVEQNDSKLHFHVQNLSDVRIQTRFAAHLRTIQLLAKFFGFVTFLPYKSSKTYQESLLHSQKKYREGRQPSIDLVAILNNAIENHQLVLTVPWMVEYLSMMDQVASLIGQNIVLCQLLAGIYRGLHKECLTNLNYQFLRVIIGWLMEKPLFPLQQLYRHDTTLLIESPEHHMRMNCLDCYDVVDKSLVYSCCPYLSELRVVLEIKDSSVRRSIPDVRKITPLPTNNLNNVLNAEEQLKKSLIENFYFLQPVVVKKIVEFSSERICSRFVHKINHKLEKLKVECIKNICKKFSSQTAENGTEIASSILDSCSKLCSELRSYTLHYVNTKSYSDVKKLFLFLMGGEFNQSVIDMSCELAVRSVNEFLVSWIELNAVPETMRNDIRNKVNKCMKKNAAMKLLKVISPNSEFEVSPTRILTTLKKLLTLLKCGTKTFPVQDLLAVCQEICDAMDNGHLQDIIAAIAAITRELLMALIVHIPETCEINVMVSFVNLWMYFGPDCIKLNHFISPFGLYYLQHCSEGSGDSWTKLGLLMDLLLEKNMISLGDFRNWLYDLDKDQWSDSVLCSFQDCMMPVVMKHVQKDSVDQSFCDLFYLLQLKPVTSN